VGFPDWKELLTELAGRPLVFDDNTDYPRLAQELGIEDLNSKVAARFRTRKHALSHALLTDLRTRAMVTTNYDPCLENASAVIHVEPPLQDLARQLAVGGNPWLLKLHGDIEAPDTIVLTTDQYARLETEHRALRGLVQSLMLTSHLLFVGFGFADSDFLKMSEAVAKVRELAVDEHQGAKVGTAIELRESPGRKHEQLAYHHLAPADSNVSAAARLLEILLDRIAWRCQVSGDGRGAYLLDPDYAQDATEDDEAVRQALLQLQAAVAAHTQSAGHEAIKSLLRELGLPN
jgi:SIR2-like protein